jgi:vanillate O-demethylase monooxygenase subunit
MYLRNSWYCAGWAADLDEGPVGRTLLGEYIVLFRSEAGKAIALSGRCPHRFAPLDRGKVRGDTIECPYHGLTFGTDGACVRNPHGDPIPPQARLRAYPLLERHGVLWIWMGWPSLADPAALPDDGWMVSPQYTNGKLYVRVEGNYQLVSDNLLDLTHGMYLHSTTLAAPPHPKRSVEHEMHVEGSVVHSNYYGRFMTRAAAFKNIFAPETGDLVAKMQWRPASTLNFDVAMHPADSGHQGGARYLQAHYITPETEFSSHYWAAVGRDVDVENKEEDAYEMELFTRAFVEEDEPMIRACQELMGTSDMMSLRPAVLKSDAAAIQARRILSKLIRQESGRQGETG